MRKNIVLAILTISVVCTLGITGCKSKKVDTNTNNSESTGWHEATPDEMLMLEQTASPTEPVQDGTMPENGANEQSGTDQSVVGQPTTEQSTEPYDYSKTDNDYSNEQIQSQMNSQINNETQNIQNINGDSNTDEYSNTSSYQDQQVLSNQQSVNYDQDYTSAQDIKPVNMPQEEYYDNFSSDSSTCNVNQPSDSSASEEYIPPCDREKY